ncbi:hypothetical protein I8748_30065 [Nostoc sp. CENA67]|uniref:Uncharacterized protein n=1 Tax=Amazonocrinis nigriterrae CENA67 TaxID=2794033 RepID=A0A8J7LC38_9NOST|nr:hypothetical protein [Amazonocrinis nigriterrae]MBH8566350.1 hypothetical protein [Amazonocrinis nigriterrae CENA67]
MLKHTKFLLGATLFYFSTVTVVYGNTPRQLCQNDTNVLSKLCEEVREDENFEVLLPESKAKNFIINIVQDPTPLPTPSPGTTSPTQVQGSWPEQIGSVVQGIFDYGRSVVNGLTMKKTFEQSPGLVSSNMETPYILAKHGEKIFDSIRSSIVLNPLPLRATKVAMIPGSYSTIAQSELTQQILDDAIRRNLYIDIRTKLTYLKTFSDALEAMKKLDNYPEYNTISNQVRSDLENNIKELSNSEALVQQFNASIPNLDNKVLIAEHEKKFVEFATQQIRKAEDIPGLEKAVSDTMNQNLDDSVKLITSLVNQELKLIKSNNSGLRSSNQRRNRSRTAGSNL